MAELLVLAMDGSTRTCTAALLRLRVSESGGSEQAGWEVAARRAESDGRGQARVLLRMVDEMLSEVDRVPVDLGVIVVGVGPGTFTGVRITVATARALSLALSVPVVGVSTLSALAAEAAAVSAGGGGSCGERPSMLVPVVDARRGQVFFGLYEAVAEPENGQAVGWVRSRDFGVGDQGGLSEMVTAAVGRELGTGVEFVAAEVRAERLVMGQEWLGEPGEAPEGSRLTPWLVEMLGCGEGGGAWGTPELVKPIYVRSPDADIHITKMKDPWA